MTVPGGIRREILARWWFVLVRHFVGHVLCKQLGSIKGDGDWNHLEAEFYRTLSGVAWYGGAVVAVWSYLLPEVCKYWWRGMVLERWWIFPLRRYLGLGWAIVWTSCCRWFCCWYRLLPCVSFRTWWMVQWVSRIGVKGVFYPKGTRVVLAMPTLHTTPSLGGLRWCLFFLCSFACYFVGFEVHAYLLEKVGGFHSEFG